MQALPCCGSKTHKTPGRRKFIYCFLKQAAAGEASCGEAMEKYGPTHDCCILISLLYSALDAVGPRRAETNPLTSK